jgi:hypothetical protein
MRHHHILALLLLCMATMTRTLCTGQTITQDTTISKGMIVTKNNLGYSVYNTTGTLKNVVVIHGTDTMYNCNVDKIHVLTKTFHPKEILWLEDYLMVILAEKNNDEDLVVKPLHSIPKKG